MPTRQRPDFSARKLKGSMVWWFPGCKWHTRPFLAPSYCSHSFFVSGRTMPCKCQAWPSWLTLWVWKSRRFSTLSAPVLADRVAAGWKVCLWSYLKTSNTLCPCLGTRTVTLAKKETAWLEKAPSSRSGACVRRSRRLLYAGGLPGDGPDTASASLDNQLYLFLFRVHQLWHQRPMDKHATLRSWGPDGNIWVESWYWQRPLPLSIGQWVLLSQ